MDITIKATLLKRKEKKDGTIPVYIRLTKDRKSRYLSTGLNVLPNQWNDREKKVRKNHPQYRLYNKQIKKKVREIESEYLNMDDTSNVDPKKLKEKVQPKEKDGVLYYADIYREHVRKQKRFYEYKKFGTIIENMTAFLRGKEIKPKKLDAKFASGFQEYLLDNIGNNPKTTNRKISSLRGFLNWMVDEKLLESDPFLQIKIVPPSESSKARLSYDQIQAIKNLNLQKNSALWHTRNYFFYSFYNAGIRFGDICTLTWGNIVDGRLMYNMQKTKGMKSIKQNQEHESILKHYRSENAKPTDYIFSILRKKHDDPFELRREISSRNVVVNKNLKKIAEKAKIQTNVSFHVARHSFSQYALKKGMDVYSISKALGHSDLKVTEEYLSSFDEDLLDKSMDKLFED